ncbi:MAG: serine/threonine protein kinase [Candidatus Brocadiae bacterium]|nr:serine/threonine protein kinase [Candidatus Brocadiia bacterium]
MKGIPIFFGEIAIEEGYIDQDMLKEALEIQKLQKKPVLIGEIIIAKGWMLPDHVVRILKIQQGYKNKLENEYFAHIAMKKKLLTGKQVHELRKKLALEAAEGRTTNMANLVMNDNSLSLPLVEDIIKDQEYQYFYNLRKQQKSLIANYELVGNVIQLKKTVIYKAIQTELERLVAVKVLQKEYEVSEYIQEFFKEAKASARFNHPNLVNIYDTGLKNNFYYYAMELVDGENLTQKLSDEGRLQVAEALKIIRQVLQALEHIHNCQYIHGKVSPRNIIIREDKVAKLLDLGGCCKANKEYPSKVTKMPQYMAPEQFKTPSVWDVKTDIYSVGATFYRMLTGRPPVSGKTLEEIKENCMSQEPTPIQEVDFTIPEDLAKIVHRMMRKDPQKRYPEIKNVLIALRKILI